MSDEGLLKRAKALKLYGLIEYWSEYGSEPWVRTLVEREEAARYQRSLETRLKNARLGRFKLLADFDWNWPKHNYRETVMQWMNLDFLQRAENLILCGPNGVGKSLIACNIGYTAVMKGHTALFTTAANMLNELSALDSVSALNRRLKYYSKPSVLVIDEVGYLSYSNRLADLFFEVINQRYEEKSTIITTNKGFSEWPDIFPNAACVVSIIDRLVHHSDIINIDAKSYRLKEAEESKSERQKSSEKKKTKTS